MLLMHLHHPALATSKGRFKILGLGVQMIGSRLELVMCFEQRREKLTWIKSKSLGLCGCNRTDEPIIHTSSSEDAYMLKQEPYLTTA